MAIYEHNVILPPRICTRTVDGKVQILLLDAETRERIWLYITDADAGQLCADLQAL